MSRLRVVVVMGSKSDLKIMRDASLLLKQWKVTSQTSIVSAHRTPHLLDVSVQEWERRGVEIIIAGAGGAAHLPGMIASLTYLPVIGVPIKSSSVGGLDALLSIVQMPRGVPVATVSIDGATNAAILAAQILSLRDGKQGKFLRTKIVEHKMKMKREVKKQRSLLKAKGIKKFLLKSKKL